MNSNTNFFENSKTISKKNHGKYLDTITPVLISWLISKIKTVKEDYILLDNYSCDKFSIIGIIDSHNQIDNKFCLKISDGTGQMEITCIKKYEEKLPFCLKEINFKKKIYVRAVIDISIYNNDEGNVVIFSGLSFSEIKNYNCISFHFLETLAYKNYRQNGFFNKNNIKKPSNNKKLLEKIENKNFDEITKSKDSENDVDFNENFKDGDIPKMILKTIKSVNLKTHVSVSLKKICEVLKNVDKTKIEEHLSNLNEEGIIFVEPGTNDCYDIF